MSIEVKDNTGKLVTVISNDVDLLILLITQSDGYDIFFYKQTRKNVLYSSKDNSDFQKYILFAHAFSGCDSTSAIFNKGKKSIVTLIKKNEELQKLIRIFYKPDQHIDDLYEIAEKLIKKLYGLVYEEQSLQELRYNSFVTATTVENKELVEMVSNIKHYKIGK